MILYGVLLAKNNWYNFWLCTRRHSSRWKESKAEIFESRQGFRAQYLLTSYMSRYSLLQLAQDWRPLCQAVLTGPQRKKILLPKPAYFELSECAPLLPLWVPAFCSPRIHSSRVHHGPSIAPGARDTAVNYSR